MPDMPSFKRLVSWVHDIPADTPEQADQLARITAEAVNTALKALGHGTAWAAIVTDEDCDEGGLTDILDGLYLLDEDEGCVAHVPAEETVAPERLIAWRDAAVKAATAELLARIGNARSEIARQDVDLGRGLIGSGDVREILDAVETHLVDVPKAGV